MIGGKWRFSAGLLCGQVFVDKNVKIKVGIRSINRSGVRSIQSAESV